MRLISMTDFVLNESTNKEVSKNFSGFTDIVNNKKLSYDNILSYAKFLKQPLELGMFVPCLFTGGYNVVLEEPKCNVCGVSMGDYCGRSKECAQSNENEFMIYREAKEKCLFKGFEWKLDESFAEEVNGLFDIKSNRFICALDIGMTIEDLVCINSELTKTAIKKIGL